MRRILACLVLWPLLQGCVHSGAPAATTATAATDADELPGPEALGVTDPDPEADAGTPQFCNPTERHGDDQQKCYEHNEAMYQEFDDEAKRREPWFNFAPGNWVASTEVDGRYVLPVVKVDEAVNKLEDAPLVELQSNDIPFFTGKKVDYPGRHAFLVRGLMYFRETGAFTVFEKDQAILVRHDSLGESPPGETRAAVVVFLAYQPKAVYVDCQVAE